MRQKRQVPTALLDASSAIILYKAELHIIVCEMYNVVMSSSVYDEITESTRPGAKAYRQLLVDRKFGVQKPVLAPRGDGDMSELLTLDKGERDVIQLCYRGYGDFVITDDGAAARYCRRKQVRFINALLIPVILRFSGKRGEPYCRTVFSRLKSIGRYSRWVVHYAENCEREDVSFFLP